MFPVLQGSAETDISQVRWEIIPSINCLLFINTQFTARPQLCLTGGWPHVGRYLALVKQKVTNEKKLRNRSLERSGSDWVKSVDKHSRRQRVRHEFQTTKVVFVSRKITRRSRQIEKDHCGARTLLPDHSVNPPYMILVR